MMDQGLSNIIEVQFWSRIVPPEKDVFLMSYLVVKLKDQQEEK